METPTHILGCARAARLEQEGRLLKCEIVCSCGGQIFKLLYPGQKKDIGDSEIPCTLQIEDKFFFLIKARCINCDTEYLLFDKDFHGWDGYLCHNERAALTPRPSLDSWKCQKCDSESHSIVVGFSYGDLDDIKEDIGGGQIDNYWDVFEWISMDIQCDNCGHITNKWVDYETA